MFAVDSTEAVYRFMGIKAQESLILLLAHHWVFLALVALVIAWRLLKTGYLLNFLGFGQKILVVFCYLGEGVTWILC
jgi:hypothetical protein